MKKYYAILMLVFYLDNALAQNYRPLLEEGKQWIVAGVHADWAGSPFLGSGQYDIYTLRGETTMYGQAWKQLFCYKMDEQGNKGEESRVALLREDDGKVYFYDTADIPYAGPFIYVGLTVSELYWGEDFYNWVQESLE